ncbi:hypothetical protein MUK70_03430 [Dyadobacter chenwenxiniae]|uniref:Transposase n=1 Tax=Dyadobacter chenwenxiniae TaxID=2906456 RepID=A0A9X1TIF4_9BACT|nr:hypothetical protein [Dyadobacter chenwenxiniae]MCF0065800.1 hypothetical protein [Dyadobacter chenwenxiniae]UON84044.1 hypothetical protein MUK70_03430 [Dyadobacter chenwenxiniae]
MKLNGLIVIKKNYKNSKFRSQVVELCRSGIFSDQQLLSQLKISRTSLKAWHRWRSAARYMRYRLGRWLRTKPRVPMKKESDELLALKQKLAAVEKENERLKLKNEGLEIMINIAEKHRAACAV